MGLDKFRRAFRINGALDLAGTLNAAAAVNLAAGGTLTGTFAGTPAFSGTPTFTGSQFRMPFVFVRGNLAASLTDSAFDAVSYVSSGTAITAITQIPMPAAAKLRSVAVYLNGTATAGSALFKPTKNGTAGNLTAAITNGSGTVVTGGTTTFVAGDRLGLICTTDGNWDGTTADVSATVLVEI